MAVGMIETCNWPNGKMVLCGPKGAGKSHLARIWADTQNAQVIAAKSLALQDVDLLAQQSVCVEDVPDIAGDRTAETALFHLHNLLAQSGHLLLLTGCGPSAGWGIELPDLASRIAAAQQASLDTPDDGLLVAVLLKLLDDRQLQVEPGVVDFILLRMQRSFAGVQHLVEALDRVSLQRKRPIGLRLAGQVLKQLEGSD